MPNRKPDDELLAAALGRSKDCPPVEQFDLILSGNAAKELREHVDQCAHCKAELQMLRCFTSNEIRDEERAPVEAIVACLKAPRVTQEGAEEAIPWWQRIFAVGWLAPAAGAVAALLVVAGITLQLRHSQQPSLEVPSGGPEVLRSAAIAIQSPVGDVQEKPSEIRWQAVPNAARYTIRLLEVDETEVWSTDSTSSRMELPAPAAKLIVPAKTLLIRITAFDAAGAQIGESGTVRFRLLQKLYTR